MDELRYANRFSISVHNETGETILSFAQTYKLEADETTTSDLATSVVSRIVLNRSTATELVKILSNCLGLEPPKTK